MTFGFPADVIPSLVRPRVLLHQVSGSLMWQHVWLLHSTSCSPSVEENRKWKNNSEWVPESCFIFKPAWWACLCCRVTELNCCCCAGGGQTGWQNWGRLEPTILRVVVCTFLYSWLKEYTQRILFLILQCQSFVIFLPHPWTFIFWREYLEEVSSFFSFLWSVTDIRETGVVQMEEM